MGASEQQRFVEAARNARTDGGIETAAHMLSGLAMFDILPALASLDHFSRDRVLGRARSVLAPGAFQRVQFAAAVVATLKIPTAPASLPNDQVEDARRYLVGRLKPANSQAAFASYSSMNAAAIQALDEVALLTSAVGREFAGSIYKQNGAFKFTPAQMGGVDWSSSAVAIPRGTQWVAIYHTHPDVNPNAGNFSPEDIMIGRGNGNGRPPLVLYLGTPKRQIKKLTPPRCSKAPMPRTTAYSGSQSSCASAYWRTTVLPNEQRWRAEGGKLPSRPRGSRPRVTTRVLGSAPLTPTEPELF